MENADQLQINSARNEGWHKASPGSFLGWEIGNQQKQWRQYEQDGGNEQQKHLQSQWCRLTFFSPRQAIIHAALYLFPKSFDDVLPASKLASVLMLSF